MASPISGKTFSSVSSKEMEKRHSFTSPITAGITNKNRTLFTLENITSDKSAVSGKMTHKSNGNMEHSSIALKNRSPSPHRGQFGTNTGVLSKSRLFEKSSTIDSNSPNTFPKSPVLALKSDGQSTPKVSITFSPRGGKFDKYEGVSASDKSGEIQTGSRLRSDNLVINATRKSQIISDSYATMDDNNLVSTTMSPRILESSKSSNIPNNKTGTKVLVSTSHEKSLLTNSYSKSDEIRCDSVFRDEGQRSNKTRTEFSSSLMATGVTKQQHFVCDTLPSNMNGKMDQGSSEVKLGVSGSRSETRTTSDYSVVNINEGSYNSHVRTSSEKLITQVVDRTEMGGRRSTSKVNTDSLEIKVLPNTPDGKDITENKPSLNKSLSEHRTIVMNETGSDTNTKITSSPAVAKKFIDLTERKSSATLELNLSSPKPQVNITMSKKVSDIVASQKFAKENSKEMAENKNILGIKLNWRKSTGGLDTKDVENKYGGSVDEIAGNKITMKGNSDLSVKFTKNSNDNREMSKWDKTKQELCESRLDLDQGRGMDTVDLGIRLARSGNSSDKLKAQDEEFIVQKLNSNSEVKLIDNKSNSKGVMSGRANNSKVSEVEKIQNIDIDTKSADSKVSKNKMAFTNEPKDTGFTEKNTKDISHKQTDAKVIQHQTHKHTNIPNNSEVTQSNKQALSKNPKETRVTDADETGVSKTPQETLATKTHSKDIINKSYGINVGEKDQTCSKNKPIGISISQTGKTELVCKPGETTIIDESCKNNEKQTHKRDAQFENVEVTHISNDSKVSKVKVQDSTKPTDLHIIKRDNEGLINKPKGNKSTKGRADLSRESNVLSISEVDSLSVNQQRKEVKSIEGKVDVSGRLDNNKVKDHRSQSIEKIEIKTTQGGKEDKGGTENRGGSTNDPKDTTTKLKQKRDFSKKLSDGKSALMEKLKFFSKPKETKVNQGGKEMSTKKPECNVSKENADHITKPKDKISKVTDKVTNESVDFTDKTTEINFSKKQFVFTDTGIDTDKKSANTTVTREVSGVTKTTTGIGFTKTETDHKNKSTYSKVHSEKVDFTNKTADVGFNKVQVDFHDKSTDSKVDMEKNILTNKSVNLTIGHTDLTNKSINNKGFEKSDYFPDESIDSEKISAKVKVDPKKLMEIKVTQDREFAKKSTGSMVTQKEDHLSAEFTERKGTGERNYVTVESADDRVTKDTEHLTNKSTSIKVSQVQTKNWTENDVSQDRECFTVKSTDRKIMEEKLYLTYKLSDAKISKERELVTDKPLDKEGLLSKLELTKILADIGDVNENSDDYVIEIKITEKDQPVLERQSTAKVSMTNEKDAGAEQKMREQLYDTAKDLLLKEKMADKPKEAKVLEKSQVCNADRSKYAVTKHSGETDFVGKSQDVNFTRVETADLVKTQTSSVDIQGDNVGNKSKTGISTKKVLKDQTGKPTDNKVSQKEKDDLTGKATDSKNSQKEKVDLTGKPTDTKVSQKEKVDLTGKAMDNKVSQKEKVDLTGKPMDNKVSQKEKVDLTGKAVDNKVSQKEKIDLTGKPTDNKVSQKEKVDLTGKAMDNKVSQKEKVDLASKPSDSKVSQKEKVDLTGKPTDSKVSQKGKEDLISKPTDSQVSQKEKEDLISKPTDSQVSQKEKVDLTGKPIDSKVSQKEKVDLTGKPTDSKVSQKEKVDLTSKPTDSKVSQKDKSTDSKLYQNEDVGIPNKPTEKKDLLKKVIDDSTKPPETKGSQKGKFDFKVKLRETKLTSKGEVDQPVMQLGTKAGLKEKVDLMSKVTQDKPVQKNEGNISSKTLEAKHVQVEKVDLSITQTKSKGEQEKVEFKFKPTETKVEEKGTVDLTGKLAKDRDLQNEKDQLTSKQTELEKRKFGLFDKFKELDVVLREEVDKEKGKATFLQTQDKDLQKDNIISKPKEIKALQKEKVDLAGKQTETKSSQKEKEDFKSKLIETKALLKEKVDLTSKPTETKTSQKEKEDFKSKLIETKVLLKEKVDLTSKPTETIDSKKEKVDLSTKPTETKASLKEKVNLTRQTTETISTQYEKVNLSTKPTETKAPQKEKVDLTSKPTETKSSLKEKVDLTSKSTETISSLKETVDLKSKTIETKAPQKEKVDLTSKPTETKSSLKEKVDLTSKSTETKSSLKEKVDLTSKPTETKSSLKEKVDLTSKPTETKSSLKEKVDLTSKSTETISSLKETVDLKSKTIETKAPQKEKVDLKSNPTETKAPQKEKIDLKSKPTETISSLKEKVDLTSKPTETKAPQKERVDLTSKPTETKSLLKEKLDLVSKPTEAKEKVELKVTQKEKVDLKSESTETKPMWKEKVDLKVIQREKEDLTNKPTEVKPKWKEKVDLKVTEKKDVDIRNKSTDTKPSLKEKDNLKPKQERMSKPTETKSGQKEKESLKPRQVETKDEQKEKVDLQARQKGKEGINIKLTETKSKHHDKVDLGIKPTETKSTPKEKVDLKVKQNGKIDISIKPSEAKSKQQDKVDLSMKPTETKSAQKERVDLQVVQKEKVDLTNKPMETKSEQQGKVDAKVKKKEKVDLTNKSMETKSEQQAKVVLNIKQTETISTQKEKEELLSTKKEKIDLSIKPTETISMHKEKVDFSIKQTKTKFIQKEKVDFPFKPTETKSTQKEKVDLSIKPAETKTAQKEKVDLSIQSAETKTAQKEKVDLSIQSAETKTAQKEKVDLSVKSAETKTAQKEKVDLSVKSAETKTAQKEKDLSIKPAETRSTQKEKMDLLIKQEETKSTQKEKMDLLIKQVETKIAQKEKVYLSVKPAETKTAQKEKVDLSIKPAETKSAQKEKVDLTIKPTETKSTHKEKVDLPNKPTEAITNQKDKTDILNKVTETKLAELVQKEKVDLTNKPMETKSEQQGKVDAKVKKKEKVDLTNKSMETKSEQQAKVVLNIKQTETISTQKEKEELLSTKKEKIDLSIKPTETISMHKEKVDFSIKQTKTKFIQKEKVDFPFKPTETKSTQKEKVDLSIKPAETKTAQKEKVDLSIQSAETKTAQKEKVDLSIQSAETKTAQKEKVDLSVKSAETKTAQKEKVDLSVKSAETKTAQKEKDLSIKPAETRSTQKEKMDLLIKQEETKSTQKEKMDLLIKQVETKIAQKEKVYLSVKPAETKTAQKEKVDLSIKPAETKSAQKEKVDLTIKPTETKSTHKEKVDLPNKPTEAITNQKDKTDILNKVTETKLAQAENESKASQKSKTGFSDKQTTHKDLQMNKVDLNYKLDKTKTTQENTADLTKSPADSLTVTTDCASKLRETTVSQKQKTIHTTQITDTKITVETDDAKHTENNLTSRLHAHTSQQGLSHSDTQTDRKLTKIKNTDPTDKGIGRLPAHKEKDNFSIKLADTKDLKNLKKDLTNKPKDEGFKVGKRMEFIMNPTEDKVTNERKNEKNEDHGENRENVNVADKPVDKKGTQKGNKHLVDKFMEAKSKIKEKLNVSKTTDDKRTSLKSKTEITDKPTELKVSQNEKVGLIVKPTEPVSQDSGSTKKERVDIMTGEEGKQAEKSGVKDLPEVNRVKDIGQVKGKLSSNEKKHKSDGKISTDENKIETTDASSGSESKLEQPVDLCSKKSGKILENEKSSDKKSSDKKASESDKQGKSVTVSKTKSLANKIFEKLTKTQSSNKKGPGEVGKKSTSGNKKVEPKKQSDLEHDKDIKIVSPGDVVLTKTYEGRNSNVKSNNTDTAAESELVHKPDSGISSKNVNQLIKEKSRALVYTERKQTGDIPNERSQVKSDIDNKAYKNSFDFPDTGSCNLHSSLVSEEKRVETQHQRREDQRNGHVLSEVIDGNTTTFIEENRSAAEINAAEISVNLDNETRHEKSVSEQSVSSSKTLEESAENGGLSLSDRGLKLKQEIDDLHAMFISKKTQWEKTDSKNKKYSSALWSDPDSSSDTMNSVDSIGSNKCVTSSDHNFTEMKNGGSDLKFTEESDEYSYNKQKKSVEMYDVGLEKVTKKQSDRNDWESGIYGKFCNGETETRRKQTPGAAKTSKTSYKNESDIYKRMASGRTRSESANKTLSSSSWTKRCDIENMFCIRHYKDDFCDQENKDRSTKNVNDHDPVISGKSLNEKYSDIYSRNNEHSLSQKEQTISQDSRHLELNGNRKTDSYLSESKNGSEIGIGAKSSTKSRKNIGEIVKNEILKQPIDAKKDIPSQSSQTKNECKFLEEKKEMEDEQKLENIRNMLKESLKSNKDAEPKLSKSLLKDFILDDDEDDYDISGIMGISNMINKSSSGLIKGDGRDRRAGSLGRSKVLHVIHEEDENVSESGDSSCTKSISNDRSRFSSQTRHSSNDVSEDDYLYHRRSRRYDKNPVDDETSGEGVHDDKQNGGKYHVTDAETNEICKSDRKVKKISDDDDDDDDLRNGSVGNIRKYKSLPDISRSSKMDDEELDQWYKNKYGTDDVMEWLNNQVPMTREPSKAYEYKVIEQDFSVPSRSYIDHLTTYIPPRLPIEKPELFEISPETATLTWKPARVPDRIRDTCNLSYTIEVRNPPALDWRELVTGLTSTSYDLKNLHPRLDYLFRIRAWNEYGCSEPTLPISLHRPIEISNDDYSDDEDWDDQYKVTLGDLAPPKLPMEAPRVTDGGESAMLSWFPARIPAYAKKTPITYIIEIKEPNIPGWSRLSSGISDTTYFVEDLRPKEDYQFRVKAETQFGVSDPTLPVSLDRRPKGEGSVLDLDYYEIFKKDWEDKSTKRPSIEMRRDDLDLDIPQRNRESSIPTGVPPRIPSSRPLISHQFSDRLTLSWLPGRVPSYVKNSKISYLIEVRELPSTKWRVLVDNLDDNEYDVTNLQPDQNYMFRVRAKNSHGSSDPTLPANVIHDKDDYVPLVHSRSGSIDSGSPWVRSRASSVDSVRKQKSFDFTDDDSDIYINRESKGYPPEFKAPVEDLHYGVEGKSAKVTLGVRGYPLPTTTWYFLGDKLDYGNLYKAFITPGGTATLEINKLTIDLAGDYKCCAENEHGTAVKIVKLEIADPPTIIESTRDLALENRRSGKLVCRVDGTPTPTVKFLKDWRPLASSSRMKIHHEPPDQWSLSLDNAITMDSGLYACVAENMAGKATCLAKIAVEDEDSSTEDRDVKPKHQQIKEGWAEDYYYVLEEIGRGRHGIVRRVIDKSSGSEYAAKFIHVCDDQQRQFFHHEIENLKSLNHKNTLGIVDAFQTDRRLVIITELITGGELLHRVTAQDSWTEGDTASVIQQLLETVKYLHKHGVLHLDIKPSNIHYTSPDSDDVKLIDFGFSRHLRRDLVTKLNYGTPGFTSPEQIANEPLSSATDVWGIGTLTYLLLLGRCPFDAPTDAGKLTKIQAFDWQTDDSQSDGISKDATDFISKVLLKEPSKRLSLEECLSHPWIKNSSKGQGHKADLEKLKTFQSSDIDQRRLSGVRTVAKLHSLNWILGDHTDDSTLKQTVNDSTGQTSFPDSVPYGEFLDQESWYEWQSRVYYGLDADVDAESDTESVSGEPSLKKEREWLRVAEEFKQQSQKPQDFFPKDEEEDNPQFTIKLHDKAFQVGDDIILPCHVTSSGSLNVSWYRNEELITDGGRIRTSISDSGIVTLTVVSSKPYDDGIYKCVVRNQSGKSSSSCRVSLGDIPSQPGRPVVTQISSSDALLVWEHPESDGNSDIIQYRVDYREKGSSQWKVGARTIDDCALVTGLLPDTCYRFRVSCSNEFGTSSYSVATVETKTKSAGSADLELSDFTALLLSQQHEQHTPPTVKTVSEEDVKPREVTLQDTPFEEGYTTSDTLTRGRFSSLVLSRSKASDKTHVTKIVPYTEANKDFVLNEYETLRKLSHERLVRLYGSYLSKDMLYLVLEYLSGVNVLEHFSFKTKYTEDMVATVVKQVLDGVHYLHQQGYVHLNLQPDSVVMVTRRRLNIRITGFKLARKATKEGEIVPQKGNSEFMAPEVVTQEKTSYPADIWTVGVLTFILLSGESPYLGLTEQVTFSNIAYNRYNALALYENITKEALKFIFRTLKRIPRNRITSEESLDDKWIQSSDIMVRSRRNATFSTAKLRAYVNQCHRQLPKYSVADLETLRQRFYIKQEVPRQSVVKTEVTEDEKKTQQEKKQQDDSAPSKEEVKGNKAAKESEGTSQAPADEVQTGEVVKSSSVEDIAETLVIQAMEDALQSNEINKEE